MTTCTCPSPRAGPSTVTDYTDRPVVYRLCSDCGLPLQTSGVPEQVYLAMKRRDAVRDTAQKGAL